MEEYTGAFVAFDVAKTKHAVAIAEPGRTGEVRFLGEVENTPARIERTIKKLAARYGRLIREQVDTRLRRRDGKSTAALKAKIALEAVRE
jgi:hypothetical protein